VKNEFDGFLPTKRCTLDNILELESISNIATTEIQLFIQCYHCGPSALCKWNSAREVHAVFYEKISLDLTEGKHPQGTEIKQRIWGLGGLNFVVNISR